MGLKKIVSAYGLYEMVPPYDSSYQLYQIVDSAGAAVVAVGRDWWAHEVEMGMHLVITIMLAVLTISTKNKNKVIIIRIEFIYSKDMVTYRE